MALMLQEIQALLTTLWYHDPEAETFGAVRDAADFESGQRRRALVQVSTEIREIRIDMCVYSETEIPHQCILVYFPSSRRGLSGFSL